MLLSTAVTILAFAGELTAAPISYSTARYEVAKRQSITTPLGINITDLGLGDISPIEDGFLEQDNDSGGETENGGTAVSNSNGFGGTVGSGQSGQTTNGGSQGTSAACSLTGCATSGAASNGNSTSTSSSSSGLINGGLINGGLLNGGLLNLSGNNVSPRDLVRRFLTWLA